MTQIGYARVSSIGQSLDIQLDKLNGCDKIFKEKKSGTTAQRPAFKDCMNYLREGDTLVITRLDRLARSTYHLTQIAEDLKSCKIGLRVIDQNIDTSTPTGMLLFNVLASIAEFETEIRKERQLEGIAKAKENGIKFGAKAKLTKEQLDEMKGKREAGVLIKNLMKEYSLSKSSVYRLIQR